jgi:hypothetical protein
MKGPVMKGTIVTGHRRPADAGDSPLVPLNGTAGRALAGPAQPLPQHHPGLGLRVPVPVTRSITLATRASVHISVGNPFAFGPAPSAASTCAS